MRMKGVRRTLVLFAALALVATACGDDEGGDTTSTTQPAATSTTASDGATTTTAAPTTTTEAPPPEAVTIKVGLGNMPPSAMPYLGAGSPGQYVWSNLFDGLTRIGPDGAAEPALAESWSVADDNLTWTFELRDGVTFSNGEALDAAAVAATYDTVLSEDGRATYSANVNNYGFIESVTASA